MNVSTFFRLTTHTSQKGAREKGRGRGLKNKKGNMEGERERRPKEVRGNRGNLKRKGGWRRGAKWRGSSEEKGMGDREEIRERRK